jgi:hypothetical protein
MSNQEIDWNSLPEPIPADAPYTPTPQTQNVVQQPGHPFEQIDFSALPEPLPAERSTLADMGVAAVHGIESAARETVKTFGSMVNQTIVPAFARDAVGSTAEKLMPNPLTPKPETWVGKLEADLIRFGLGFMAGGKIVHGVGAAANMAKSGIGTGIVSDSHEERLSNFIQEYPSLKNPLTDYLSAKDTDTTAEGKFKASLEDVLTNSVAQLAFKTFKVAKNHISGNPSDASALAEDIVTSKHPKGPAVVDPVVKAEQARQAVTPAWSPITLSDEKAILFKQKVDELMQSTMVPAHDGTINTTHMTSGPDVLNTISELSKLIEPEMQAVGFTAHQTNKMTAELADQLGTTPGLLIGGLNAAGATADQLAPLILAGRKTLQGMASNVAKAAERSLNTGEGAELAIEQVKQFSAVLSSFKSLQTGVARGLQVMGAKTDGFDLPQLGKAIDGKKPEDVIKILVAAEGDPTVLAKLVQASETSVLGKVVGSHNEAWINALLSSPKTHVVNVTSTAANTLLQPLNLVVGGTLRREWGDVKEGLAMYNGLRLHLRESLELARKAWLTERSILDSNSTHEILPQISSINYNLDPNTVLGQGVDWLGKLVRTSTRFLGAEDELFKQLNYRAKVHVQATREAADMIKAGKLDAKDLDSFVRTKAEAAFSESGAATNKEALEYARRTTFTADLKVDTWMGNRSFGETVSSVASTHPVLRGTVLPFTRVPANLARQATDYSPLAPIRKQFWSDLQAGGQKKTEAIGRISIGTTMWTAAGFLAIDGHITGAAPADPDLRKQLLDTGWQPYSIKVGDSYISYNRFDPFGTALGLVADFHQITGHLPEKDRDSIAEVMTLSLVNNLASKSYLKGLIDTLSVVGSSDEKKIHRWLQQRAGSYVPAVLAAASPDREMKDARSVLDAALTKIPGYSSTVEAQRDLFGQKRMMPGGFPFSAFNPFPVSTEKKDPVRDELARLAMSPAQAQWSTPPRHIGNIDLTEFKLPSGQTALDRYHELIGTVKDGAGRDLHKAMADKIQSSIYQRGTDGSDWYKTGSRVDMLRSVHDHFKDRALLSLKRELPALADALRDDKRKRLSMKHGREVQDPIEILNSLGR